MPRVEELPSASSGALLGDEILVGEQLGEVVRIPVLDVVALAVEMTLAQSGIFASGSTGPHNMPILASFMRPSVTGGCASLALVAIAANQPDVASLDFDKDTIEYAQFELPMPKSWNEGTIIARFKSSRGAGATAFDAVWGIQCVAISSGDSIGANYGTAQEVTVTHTNADTLYASSETAAITPAGSPVESDTLCFRVYRKASDAADTLDVDARLHAIMLTITTNAENDT